MPAAFSVPVRRSRRWLVPRPCVPLTEMGSNPTGSWWTRCPLVRPDLGLGLWCPGAASALLLGAGRAGVVPAAITPAACRRNGSGAPWSPVESLNLSLTHTPRRGLPNGISAHRMRVDNRLRKPYNRQRIATFTATSQRPSQPSRERDKRLCPPSAPAPLLPRFLGTTTSTNCNHTCNHNCNQATRMPVTKKA